GDWQERLQEILALGRGRAAWDTLGCSSQTGPAGATAPAPEGPTAATEKGTVLGESNSLPGWPVESWLATLNRGLRHPSIRELGPEALRVLLRRAVAHALAGHASPDLPYDSWVRDG